MIEGSPLRTLVLAGRTSQLGRFNPALVAAVLPDPDYPTRRTLLLVAGSAGPLLIHGDREAVERVLFADGETPQAPAVELVRPRA